jgi:hypothetical protein
MPKKLVALVSLLALLVILSAWTRVPSCGLFTFTGTAVDTGDTKGVDMNLGFGFRPPNCGSNCTCNLVAYVQIVRTISVEDATYLYPSTEKQNRATADGWYVDRNQGKVWGYYGRKNDGTFDLTTLDSGTESKVATLFDKPWRYYDELGQGIRWQAVSAPVCLQSGSACQNKVLGYYFWSWTAGVGTSVSILHEQAWRPLEEQVDAAVVKWNADAPGLGKNVFPAFTKLSP